LTEVRGIPDQSSIPSVFLNYQTVQTISPSTGATGIWSTDMQLIPHPVGFCSGFITDSNNPANSAGFEVLNTQLAGTTHVAKFDSFLSEFVRWRLAYASVTIYQDGPDLANQGTIVVCQKPLTPYSFNPNSGNNAGLYTAQTGYSHGFIMEPTDLPSYTSSQAMPNAYFGKSKEGAYVPLKLTKTHQEWRSNRDLTYQCSAGALNPFNGGFTSGQVQIPFSTAAINSGLYPFRTLNDLHFYQIGGTGSAGTLAGDLTSDFCNENWADISVRNMAVTTSLSMFFRFGFECQVQPTSVMAPHMKLSPPEDIQALQSYFAVSRELKDAYPADYNDLGKIWDAISGIAKTIAPAFSIVPGVGPAISGGIGAITGIGDSIRGVLKRASAPTQGNVASSADKARANDYVREMDAINVDNLVRQAKSRIGQRRAPARGRQRLPPMQGPRRPPREGAPRRRRR